MESSANNTASDQQLGQRRCNAKKTLVSSAKLLLVFLILSMANLAMAASNLTTISLTKQTGLQPVGMGTVRWFGFRIYDASLWTASGEFKNLADSLPVALHITYQKNITSSALAERTAQEWEQLDIYNVDERKQWQQRLTAIWPSVKPGDSITTLVTADKQTHFYYNNQIFQIIEDADFGIALLSIWLHPNTSQPDLRRELTGQKEG